MRDDDPESLDWLNLPSGAVSRWLWSTLHDAVLVSSKSDLLNRTIELYFQIQHLQVIHTETTFRLLFHDVTRVRATIMARWPGQVTVPQGASKDEESRLIAEYWKKWREESLSWGECESALAVNCYSVSDAVIATDSSSLAFRLQGMLDGETVDDLCCRIFIACSEMTISTLSGVSLTVDEFDQLGIDYWNSITK